MWGLPGMPNPERQHNLPPPGDGSNVTTQATVPVSSFLPTQSVRPLKRWIIERTFIRLTHNRRHVKDDETRAAMLLIAASKLMLKRLAKRHC